MTDRVTPHSLDAERAVLGAVLISAARAWPVAASLLGPGDFFRAAHSTVFATMARLAGDSVEIDLLTMVEALRAAGRLDECGGASYLASMTDGVPTSANVAHYCLASEERTLTADLRWVAVGDVSEGDRLMAFDERTPGAERRHWRHARVVASEPTVASCVRVIMDDGTSVVCTDDHKWLATGSKQGREWVRSDRLLDGFNRKGPKPAEAGRVVFRPITPWTPDASWQAGWLSGLFDGEGSMSLGEGGGGSRISLSQKPGPVLDTATRLLTERGFRMRHDFRQDSGVCVLTILGGFTEQLRLLGTIRPVRLLGDFEQKWHPRFLQGKQERRVVAIEAAGRREIQQIETTTKTLVGAGFLMHNCAIVSEKARLRAVLEAAKWLEGSAYDEDVRAGLLVDEALRRLASTVVARDGGGMVTARAAVSSYAEDLIGGKITPPIATGHRDLDELIGGFRRSNLVIIAGRPSSGKTTLALGIADMMALAGKRIAVFSLEMALRELAACLLGWRAAVSSEVLERGTATMEDYARVTEALAALDDRPLLLEATARSVTQIWAWGRRLRQEGGLDGIVIDYLQLLTAEGRFESSEAAIAAISKSLKEMAKDLDVPVVALSQLRRPPDKRADKRPHLADLRGSGALEQDADAAILIFRKDSDDALPVTELIVAKQRRGPTGTAKVQFNKALSKFEDLPRETT